MIAVAFLPGWFRLMQCFRRYHETKLPANLKNAGKYFSGLAAQGLGIFYGEYVINSASDNYFVFISFLAISIFSTAYSLYWDLYMDWGLFRSNEPGKRYLRPKILYPKNFYYIAAVTNMLMRLMWLMPFFKYTYKDGWYDYSQWDIAVLSIVEALRRA